MNLISIETHEALLLFKGDKVSLHMHDAPCEDGQKAAQMADFAAFLFHPNNGDLMQTLASRYSEFRQSIQENDNE